LILQRLALTNFPVLLFLPVTKKPVAMIYFAYFYIDIHHAATACPAPGRSLRHFQTECARHCAAGRLLAWVQ